jgi:hypothetical protein
MSKTIGILIAAMMLFACGQQETAGTAGQKAAPVAESKDALMPDVASPVSEVQIDPAVQGCLDLVAQAQWAQALPLCIQAAQVAPDNAEVQGALAQARSETEKATAEAVAAKSAANRGEAAPNLNPNKVLEGEAPEE